MANIFDADQQLVINHLVTKPLKAIFFIVLDLFLRIGEINYGVPEAKKISAPWTRGHDKRISCPRK